MLVSLGSATPEAVFEVRPLFTAARRNPLPFSSTSGRLYNVWGLDPERGCGAALLLQSDYTIWSERTPRRVVGTRPLCSLRRARP